MRVRIRPHSAKVNFTSMHTQQVHPQRKNLNNKSLITSAEYSPPTERPRERNLIYQNYMNPQQKKSQRSTSFYLNNSNALGSAGDTLGQTMTMRTSRSKNSYHNHDMENKSIQLKNDKNKQIDLYLDSQTLKQSTHQFTDQNVKLKAAVRRMNERLLGLRRRFIEQQRLQYYTEPVLKASKDNYFKKENEESSNQLRAQINQTKEQLEKEQIEFEVLKNKIQNFDESKEYVDSQPISDESIALKRAIEAVNFGNLLAVLIEQCYGTQKHKSNDKLKEQYQEIMDQIYQVFQSEIESLKQENIYLQKLLASQGNIAKQIEVKYEQIIQNIPQFIDLQNKKRLGSQSIYWLRNQVQAKEDKLRRVKVESLKRKTRSKTDISEQDQEKEEFNKLNQEKQEIILEKLKFESELNKLTQINSSKQLKSEQTLRSFESLHFEAQQDNISISNRIEQIRKINQELLAKLSIQSKENQISSNQQSDMLDSDSESKEKKQTDPIPLNRKNSGVSQNGSEKESLMGTQSLYATQNKALSSYSPFQTTHPGKHNINNDLLEEFKKEEDETNMHIKVDEQYQPQEESPSKTEYQQLSQKTDLNRLEYSDSSTKNNYIQNREQNNNTPKTSKRLDYVQVSAEENNNYESDEQYKTSEVKCLDESFQQSEYQQTQEEQPKLQYQQEKEQHLLQLPQQQQQQSNEQMSSSRNIRSKQVSMVRGKAATIIPVQLSVNIVNNKIEEKDIFIKQVQNKVELERETSKIEQLAQNQDNILQLFPNVQLQQEQQRQLNISSNLDSLFSILGVEYSSINYDIKRHRIKSSHLMQDTFNQFLYDPQEQKSFQARHFQVHKIVYDKLKIDPNLTLQQALQDESVISGLRCNSVFLSSEASSDKFRLLNNFKIGQKDAWNGIILLTNQQVTIIQILLDSLETIQSTIKEISLYKEIDSPYILKPLCTYLSHDNCNYDEEDNPMMFLNFVFPPLIGNLKQFLDQYQVQEQEKISICYQIARGIQDIHQNSIIHTQINLPNILVSHNFMVYISSLQFSSTLKETKVDKLSDISNLSDINSSSNAKNNLLNQTTSPKNLTYQWILKKTFPYLNNNENIFTQQDLSESYDFSFDIFSLGILIHTLLSPTASNNNEKKVAIQDQLQQQEHIPPRLLKIVKLCLEQQTSIQGIIYLLSQHIQQQDLQILYSQEQQLEILPTVDNFGESNSNSLFYEKGRLIKCEQNHSASHSNIGSTQLVKQFQSTNSGVICRIGNFKENEFEGKQLIVEQNSSTMLYSKNNNTNEIIIFDSTTNYLSTCKLKYSLPIIKGEIEEQFLELIIKNKGNQLGSKLVLPDCTEFSYHTSSHSLTLKKPNYGTITYTPSVITYTLPNQEFALEETAQKFTLRSLKYNLRLSMPTANSKEKLNLQSKKYNFELSNISPFYVITLNMQQTQQQQQSQSVTIILDADLKLSTFLPAENMFILTDIIIPQGVLGIVTDFKKNSIIIGVFQSSSSPCLIQGFQINKNAFSPVKNIDLRPSQIIFTSPLKDLSMISDLVSPSLKQTL